MKKLITMLSGLTITVSTTHLAVACNDKTSYQTINLNEITADMIINFEDKYVGKNESGETVTVTPDKLGSLENESIKNIIEKNIKTLLFTKSTRIDKKIFFNSMETTEKLSETDLIKLINCSTMLEKAISIAIEEKEGNNKIFIATIEKKGWNEVNKDNIIGKNIETLVKNAKEFLKKSNDEKKIMLTSENPNSTPDLIEKSIPVNDSIFKANTKLNIDEVKKGYDHFKGDKTIIEIDLTSKQ